MSRPGITLEGCQGPLLVALCACALVFSGCTVPEDCSEQAQQLKQCQYDLWAARSHVVGLQSQVEGLSGEMDVLEAQLPCPECPESLELAFDYFLSESHLRRWLAEDDTDTLTLQDRAAYAITLVQHALRDGYWMALYLHRRQECPITEQLQCYSIADETSYMVDPMADRLSELEIVLMPRPNATHGWGM